MLVLAGIPLQVRATALSLIVTDAIVQIPIEVVTVPLVPSLKLPFTQSFAHGALVPIPTLVPSSVSAPVAIVVPFIQRAV